MTTTAKIAVGQAVATKTKMMKTVTTSRRGDSDVQSGEADTKEF